MSYSQTQVMLASAVKQKAGVSVRFHEAEQLLVPNHRNDLPIEKQSKVLNESIYTRASDATTGSSGVWFHVTGFPVGERGQKHENKKRSTTARKLYVG